MLIATTAINIIFAWVIFSRSKRNWINISFAGFAVFIALWALVLAFFRMTDDPLSAIWWMKFSYVAAVLIAAFFWTFSVKFPNRRKIYSLHKAFILVPTALLIVLILIPGFLTKRIEFYSYGKEVILDKTHHFFFAVHFIVFFFGGLARILRKFFKYSGIIKMQLMYILLSVFVAGSFGVYFNLVLPSPWLATHKYIWLGPLFTAIIVGSIAYAIAKYRLMDIKLVIKRSFVFTVIVIITTAIFILGAALSVRFVDQPFSGRSLYYGAFILSILIVVGFQPLKSFLQRLTDKILFVKEYNSQKFLGEMGDSLGSTLEPTKLYQIIVNKLDGIFHCTKISLLLLHESEKEYKSVHGKGFAGDFSGSVPVTDSLIKYVIRCKSVVVSEELLRKHGEAGDLKKLPPYLKRIQEIGAGLIVPLMSKNLLIGFLLLGDKKSGGIYIKKDFDVLEIVSSQAATAIVNARLYEEMRKFNIKLRQEVAKATSGLRKANVELLRLDQAKSEFISIASHQLRTPLTIVKGYISMMLEGSFGQLTITERKSLDKVYESNERLIKLVDDLLNISRIESGRLEYDFVPRDLDEIVYGLVEEFKPLAKKKKLYLEYVRPEAPLGKVMVDDLKIKDIIGNLIDNSLKYTKQGGARVVLKEGKDLILFSIADTGLGMSRDEIRNLFKKFTRGKGKSLVHTEGSGLGLYVARKLVEAHKGRIWGESKGKGRGSKFSFTLPVVKQPAAKPQKTK